VFVTVRYFNFSLPLEWGPLIFVLKQSSLNKQKLLEQMILIFLFSIVNESVQTIKTIFIKYCGILFTTVEQNSCDILLNLYVVIVEFFQIGWLEKGCCKSQKGLLGSFVKFH
jgi:uncharacterized membrane protein YcjF (UPF0283 family)